MIFPFAKSFAQLWNQFGNSQFEDFWCQMQTDDAENFECISLNINTFYVLYVEINEISFYLYFFTFKSCSQTNINNNNNILQMILLIWDLWDEDSLMGLFMLYPFVFLPKTWQINSQFKQLNVSELRSTVKDLFLLPE